MIMRLFGKARMSDRYRRDVTDAVYEKIVAAARRPALYSQWNVPDTPLGRFEMVALHMFLFLHRMRGETGAAADLAQSVTDEFFKDVEHSLRELGIGDMGIPKRMKKLARMFYGRAKAYGEAIEENDREAFALALKRNVVPELGDWRESRDVASYAFALNESLKEVATEAIRRGELPFEHPIAQQGTA